MRGKGSGKALTAFGAVGSMAPKDNRSPLAKRLDAEVASVTPSFFSKMKTLPPRKRRRKRHDRGGKRIYLAHFVLRADPTVQFLKVGISSLNLDARFEVDRANYEIKALAESEFIATKDARLMESAFHSAFRTHRFFPTVSLATGNTECFAYSEDLVDRLRRFITGR